MDTTLKQEGNHISIHGELNLKTARQAFKLMPTFTGDITVDLTDANNTDSSALALLVHWSNRANDSGSKIKFKGASAQLQQLAKISNLSDLF